LVQEALADSLALISMELPVFDILQNNQNLPKVLISKLSP